MREARIDCQGAQHRVGLVDGDLVAVDHDTDAELTLAALGGSLPRCVALVDAWRRWRTDPVVVDRIMALGEPVVTSSAIRGSMGFRVAPAWTSRAPGSAARLLATLPEDVLRQMRVAVFEQMERERSDVAPSPLAPFVQDRVRRAAAPVARDFCFRAGWLHPTVAYQPAGPEAVASMRGVVRGSTARVALRLPLSWMREVYWRGIGMVDGAFVLQVVDDGPDSVVVRAARWKGPRVVDALATLHRDREGWGLDWLLWWRPGWLR